MDGIMPRGFQKVPRVRCASSWCLHSTEDQCSIDDHDSQDAGINPLGKDKAVGGGERLENDQ